MWSYDSFMIYVRCHLMPNTYVAIVIVHLCTQRRGGLENLLLSYTTLLPSTAGKVDGVVF